jgi:hypothetical protein
MYSLQGSSPKFFLKLLVKNTPGSRDIPVNKTVGSL